MFALPPSKLSASKNSRDAPIDIRQTSSIFLPPILTERESLFKRAPPHTGQGVSSINCSYIYEHSSSTESNSISRDLGVSIPLSQWFRIRVEYYYGTSDEVRIKFFLDADLTDSEGEKLIAATDNYYDRYGIKLTSPKGSPSSTFNETQIFIPFIKRFLSLLLHLVLVILTCNGTGKGDGNGQSTEKRKGRSKNANRTLTNVHDRSIIPVLLLTKCEYYPIGG